MNTYTITTEAAGAGVTKYIVTDAQTGEVVGTRLSKRAYTAVLVNLHDTVATFSFHGSYELAMKARNAHVAKADKVAAWGSEYWAIATMAPTKTATKTAPAVENDSLSVAEQLAAAEASYARWETYPAKPAYRRKQLAAIQARIDRLKAELGA